MSEVSACELCRVTYDKLNGLEHREDERYQEYLVRVGNENANRERQSGLLKALHTRLDRSDVQSKDLNDSLIQHMRDEEGHHTAVKETLTAILTTLKHVPTKEDLAKTNGKVATMWLVGSAVVTLLITVSLYFVYEGFKAQIISSSKANYYGTKKLIEKELRP